MQPFTECLHPSAIVGPVEDDPPCTALKDLHPPSPLRPSQTIPERFVGDRQEDSQETDCRSGKRSIDALVGAKKSDIQPEGGHLRRPEMKIRRVELPRLETEDRLGIGIHRRSQHRHAGLDDPRFFRGDGGNGRSKDLHVIEAHVGDHTRQGGDDVGRVETSTKPGLPHHEIDTGFREVAEGENRGELEEGRSRPTEPVDHGLQGGHMPCKVRIGDGDPTHLDPLAEPHEVRGGIEAHLESRVAIHALEQGADRTLSVGACDMDETETVLGITHGLCQPSRGVETQDNTGGLEGTEVVNGLGCGHGPDHCPTRLSRKPRIAPGNPFPCLSPGTSVVSRIRGQPGPGRGPSGPGR